MSDSFVKVLESADAAAKQIDNDAVDYSGTTRYRQRIAIPDGADVTLGAQADAAWTGAGSGTVVAILKKLVSVLSGTLATSRTWSLSSGTDSVNVGNFPGTQPVSAAALPLPAGAATDATLAVIFGSASDSPAAYTVLDHLTRLRKSSEQQQQTQLAVLAALRPAPAARRPQTTLLHRS